MNDGGATPVNKKIQKLVQNIKEFSKHVFSSQAHVKTLPMNVPSQK